MMVKKDNIKTLREVFRELTHLTIDWQFERRDFDEMIRAFRKGDNLTFNISIKAIPNDIIWANKLDGHPLTQELYRKILGLKIAEGN